MLLSEICYIINLVLGMKNMFEIEGVIDMWGLIF